MGIKTIIDNNRLEAFSDGVMATIITIMVLGLIVPHKLTFESYFYMLPKYMPVMQLALFCWTLLILPSTIISYCPKKWILKFFG